tara:strand:+ start:193 stop:984 length:792 start_codon:yes stop_codon:yes gene_type:complete
VNPTVSIIIPNYNHAPFLRQRIESVLNQSYQSFEVIILDDASTDNSWEVLQSYKSHEKVSHCLSNEKNSGSPFIQWQKGIELAKGEWIWIAESDDWADVGLLESLINLANNYPQAPLVFCQSTTHFKGRDEIVRHFKSRGIHNFNDHLRMFKRYNLIPNASAVIFRKDKVNQRIFSKLKKFRFCGDWLFWIHLCLNNVFAFEPTPFNHFRKHSDSVTSKFEDTPVYEKEKLLINLYIISRVSNVKFLSRIKLFLKIRYQLLKF